MCGIFGILLRPDHRLGAERARALLASLYELSESRGKESAGLHVYLPQAGRAWTLKGAQRATELLASPQYKRLLEGPVLEALGGGAQPVGVGSAALPTRALALLAHSRLVTNGAAELPQNNQPVRSGQVSMIHNGICVNVDALWQQHPQLRRVAEVDTEVMAALVNAAQARGEGAASATRAMFSELKGAASVAWVHDAGSAVTLATNTGDLYFCDQLAAAGYLVFASERYILETATREALAAPVVTGLPPGQGMVVNLLGGEASRFALVDSAAASEPFAPSPRAR